MRYISTPDEAQSIATSVAKWLRHKKHKVQVEKAIMSDAPYCTTLVSKKTNSPVILVEAQRTPSFDRSLEQLANWLFARRLFCELYIATSVNSTLTAGLLNEIAQAGVGLLLVDDSGSVRRPTAARNPCLMVTPDPTISLGKHKQEISRIVDKFNMGERKDSLRDMCELVEGETDRLLRRAITKNWMHVPLGRVPTINWSAQIDMLASRNQYSPGHNPVISNAGKADLQSFRSARNLLDHKVQDRREDKKRQQQFAERMMQGPRLLAILLAAFRRIK